MFEVVKSCVLIYLYIYLFLAQEIDANFAKRSLMFECAIHNE
jgi:hypothetical protein